MNFFRGALIVVVVLMHVGIVQVVAQNVAGAPAPAGATGPRPASTMSELMIRLIYPTSDAVFYISTRVPTSDAEWGDLQSKTLMLAENHNLPAKMIPSMEAGLPKVLALAPDQLIFYYYPRNIGDPDRNMAVIAKAMKNHWR